MKKSLSILPVVAALFLSSSIHASLVVHWPLDETTGTIAGDTSGNGINGLWQETVGTPGWQAAGGIAGGAVSFSGVGNDQFIAEPVAGFGDLPFTISLWVNNTAASTANMGLGYLGNGSGSSYYVVRMQDGFAKANARNTAEIQNQGTSFINNGLWHHLVGVYTNTTDRKIYVDGVLEGTNTTAVPILPLTRFGIGALTRNTPYNPADRYTGLMDDVQLYNTALTDSEITFLFANPGSVVPEPTTAALLSLGLALGCFRRRRS